MRHTVFALVVAMQLVPVGVLAQGVQTKKNPVQSATRESAPRPGWLEQAVRRESALANVPANADRFAPRQGQPSSPRRRGWIGRHPVLFGSLVGFGGGVLVGYAGDRSNKGLLFDDADVGVNAVVIGGIGAGLGALVGAVVAGK